MTDIGETKNLTIEELGKLKELMGLLKSARAPMFSIPISSSSSSVQEITQLQNSIHQH
ncbi:MAG: hypothetical protein ACI828_002883 [Flavobacteriales bacterium]|jgi:hypothetical protein